MEHYIVWVCARDQSWGEFEINHLGKVTLPVTKFCWWGWLRIIDAVVCKEYQSHFFYAPVEYWWILTLNKSRAHTRLPFFFGYTIHLWRLPEMGGNPKSSPLVGCSIINHPFLGSHGRKQTCIARRRKQVKVNPAAWRKTDCQNPNQHPFVRSLGKDVLSHYVIELNWIYILYIIIIYIIIYNYM